MSSIVSMWCFTSVQWNPLFRRDSNYVMCDRCHCCFCRLFSLCHIIHCFIIVHVCFIYYLLFVSLPLFIIHCALFVWVHVTSSISPYSSGVSWKGFQYLIHDSVNIDIRSVVQLITLLWLFRSMCCVLSFNYRHCFVSQQSQVTMLLWFRIHFISLQCMFVTTHTFVVVIVLFNFVRMFDCHNPINFCPSSLTVLC